MMMTKKQHVLAIAVEAALGKEVIVKRVNGFWTFTAEDMDGRCEYVMAQKASTYTYGKQSILMFGYKFVGYASPIETKYKVRIPNPSDREEFYNFVSMIRRYFEREKQCKHGGIIEHITNNLI